MNFIVIKMTKLIYWSLKFISWAQLVYFQMSAISLLNFKNEYY